MKFIEVPLSTKVEFNEHELSLLTSKVTSNIESEVIIDKANFGLSSRVMMTNQVLFWKQKKLKVIQSRIERGRHSLRIDGYDGIDFVTSHAGHFHKVVCRPSAYRSFPLFCEALKEVCGEEFYSLLKLRRLDVAMDLKMLFSGLVRHLFVQFKQKSSEFKDSSGYCGEIVFGKYPEQIVVYDKHMEKFKVPGKLSRIEIRLYSSKLPCTNVEELEGSIQKIDSFKKISLIPYSLVGVDKLDTVKDGIRYGTLSSAINFTGLTVGRKKLNRQGNFIRDFGRFIVETKEPIKLHPFFEKNIMKNFKPAQVQF